MSESSQDRIKIRCQCGVKLAVPASAVGRKVKCPKCEFKMIVPEPEPAAPAPPPISEPDDADSLGNSLLDDLFANEGNAETSQASSGGAGGGTCPNCGSAMAAGAQLCVGCGYNAATGRVQKSAKIKTPSAVGKLAKSASGYMMGCVGSGVGAALGAAVWFGIAIATGIESGWIAWGLGAAAGLGMKIGYGKENLRAGLTAIAFTLAGILVGKIAIFAFVVNAVLTGNTGDVTFQREYVILNMMEEDFEERNIWSDDERSEAWEPTYDKFERQVSRMDRDEVQERWQHYKDLEKEAVVDDEAWTLAYHHGGLMADKQGLSWTDEKREGLVDAEHEKYKAMSAEDRAAALADMEAWESGAKWDDPDYPRTFLIYRFVSELIEEAENEQGDDEEDDDYQPISAEQWKDYYDEAVARVEAMPAEELVTKAKEIVAEQEQQRQEMLAKFSEQWGDTLEDDGDSAELATGFFQVMFGWFDVIFILLAISSAFKLSGAGDEG